MSRQELLWFAVLLLLLCAAVYFAHYLIFRDVHHIFIYLIGDIAFVFLEVLLVTLVLDRLLQAREKRAREHKMNMVIGTFFSAMGQELLALMAPLVADLPDIQRHLAIGPETTDAELQAAVEYVHATDFAVVAQPEVLQPLRELLISRRELLLRLLENPVRLEHETFSDLLWAVSHLAEELAARDDLERLPASDLEHLGGDVDRAYTHLVGQWVRYMVHLKSRYPYLYSLAARTNPLRPDANAVVR